MLKRYVRIVEGANTRRALIGFNSTLLIYSLLQSRGRIFRNEKKILGGKPPRDASDNSAGIAENYKESSPLRKLLKRKIFPCLFPSRTPVSPDNSRTFCEKMNHGNFQLQPQLSRSSSRVLLTAFLRRCSVNIFALFGTENDRERVQRSLTTDAIIEIFIKAQSNVEFF